MRRYIREIDLRFALLNLLFVVITVLTVCFASYSQRQYDVRVAEYSKAAGSLVNQLEFTDHDFYDTNNVFDIPVESYLSMYNQITSCRSFELYEIKHQPIDINYQTEAEHSRFSKILGTSETFESEDGTMYFCADCTQMSQNCFDTYPIRISEGRAFEEDDFVLNPDAPLPVLLGSDFADDFSVGDSFNGCYLDYETEFEVVGFFTSDSYYVVGEYPKYLNRTIIIPFVSVLPEDIDNFRDFAFLQYTSKVTNYIHLREGYSMNDVYQETEKIANSYGLEQFDYYGIMINAKLGSIETDIDMVGFLPGLLRKIACFLFAAFAAVNFELLHSRRRTVAARLICGVKHSTVIWQWLTENLVYTLLALAVATAIGLPPSPSDLMLFAIMPAIALVVSLIVLSQRSINKILTEEAKNVG